MTFLMMVKLEILEPLLARAVKKRELDLEFSGNSIKDVVEELVRRFGPDAKAALLDKNGQIDLWIQFLVNGETWIPRDQPDYILNDGDVIAIVGPMAGG